MADSESRTGEIRRDILGEFDRCMMEELASRNFLPQFVYMNEPTRRALVWDWRDKWGMDQQAGDDEYIRMRMTWFKLHVDSSMPDGEFVFEADPRPV